MLWERQSEETGWHKIAELTCFPYAAPFWGRIRAQRDCSSDPVVFLNHSVFILHSFLQTHCPQQTLCRLWSSTEFDLRLDCDPLLYCLLSHRLWTKWTWTVKVFPSPLRNNLVLWPCLSSRLLIPSQQSTSMAQLLKQISLKSPGRAPRYFGCGFLTFLEKLGIQHFAF